MRKQRAGAGPGEKQRWRRGRRLRERATGTAWLPPTPRGGGTTWPRPPQACSHAAPLTTIAVSLSLFVMSTSIKRFPNSQSLQKYSVTTSGELPGQ